MATCTVHNLSCTTAYKVKKCKCPDCLSDKRKSRTEKEKADSAERARLWRLENPERSRENSKRYQREHPDQLFKWQLKKYGLTLEDHIKLVERSGNKCEICGSDNLYSGKTRLSIDHDHDSGKVRGLLCNNCNLGIGHFEHKEELLMSAIKYLKTNGDVYA